MVSNEIWFDYSCLRHHSLNDSRSVSNVNGARVPRGAGLRRYVLQLLKDLKAADFQVSKNCPVTSQVLKVKITGLYLQRTLFSTMNRTIENLLTQCPNQISTAIFVKCYQFFLLRFLTDSFRWSWHFPNPGCIFLNCATITNVEYFDRIQFLFVLVFIKFLEVFS